MSKVVTVSSGRLYRADFAAKVDGNGKETRGAFSRVILIDENSANRYRLAEDAEILELVNQDAGYRVFLTNVALELASDPTTGDVRPATPHEADGVTLLWQTAKVNAVSGVEIRDPWQGNTLTGAIKDALAKRS